MDTNPHYFWALKLPGDMKQYIQDELEKIKNYFPFKRWVHEQDYHITLAFLGNAKKENLLLATDLIREAITDVQSFPLYLNRIDVFGKVSSPRIFWGGVEKEPRIDKAQSLVFNSCSQSGFLLEERPFKPHITLARNWNGPVFQRELLERYNPFKKGDVPFLVNEVVLYKTNIRNTPKYEPITNLILKSE
jgi:RNA 2',3'-cyclic 3'-phosphodiesterase